MIVLSHAWWQQRLAGKADALGSTVRLSGQPYTIVGVMPPGVFPSWPRNPAVVEIGPEFQQFWVPIARTPDLEQNSRSHVLGVVARLAHGVSMDQATDELNRLGSPSAADTHGAYLAPLREQFVRDARTPLLALLGAALAVLLIACANLAALQVTALEARQGELSVRAAIGAGLGRLALQLATESLVIASAGGLSGLASGLLAQSLWSVQSEEPGFVVRNVFVADLSLPGVQYAKAGDVVQFEQRVIDALGSVPGVSGVATAYDHPLEANWTDAFRLSGDTSRDSGEVSGQAELRIVSPSYFDALGVEVLDGRVLMEQDDLEAPGAVVVNEAFARRFGAVGAVLGRRLHSRAAQLTWGDAALGQFAIVGSVENERFRGLEQAALPAVYLSTRQFPQQGFSVLVRTATDPLGFAGQVRAVVRNVDVEVAFSKPTSLEAILSEQLAARRVTTDVIGGFAGAALGLAALGLYGLLAVAVAGRTREIGVRLALGASPQSAARHVVGESLRNVVAGIAVGIGLAIIAGRLLRSLLVGVTARDAATLAVVAATLGAVAVLVRSGRRGVRREWSPRAPSARTEKVPAPIFEMVPGTNLRIS